MDDLTYLPTDPIPVQTLYRNLDYIISIMFIHFILILYLHFKFMYTYFSMQSSIISKSDLAKELALHMGWTQKKSLLFIDDCFDWIKSQMLRGHRIVLSGFGVFQLNLRKQRRLLHPITQKPLVIPERLCPNFTPSDTLLHILNHGAGL